jgi:uncharacterized cupin superfamily protein
MRVVNLFSCDPDEVLERGAFRARMFDLTERLGAAVIGATVYEMQAGEKLGPYHYHHGVEEWLYVVAGAPILRDADGERALEAGELVAFAAGPAGAHTMHGPGRVVMFSAGDRGWGEAFVTVYPDSDKVAAAPGVMFRRADAIDAWGGDANATPVAKGDQASPGPSHSTVSLMTCALELPEDGRSRDGGRVRKAMLGPRLRAERWAATLYGLEPGEETAAYHYEWCREKWALVVDGAPTLRHADGQTALSPGDVCCFPQGPAGAHGLRNDSPESARLTVFSTQTDRPMSAFYPDQDTVLIHISDHERFLFRHSDRVDDYWDGEPGAA